MDDNEREALAAVMREQQGLPDSSDKTPSTARSMWWAVSRTLAALVLLGMGAVIFVSVTDPCFAFKLSVAQDAGERAAAVMATQCRETSEGCRCRTQLAECQSGEICSFSESNPSPQCGILHVDCF